MISPTEESARKRRFGDGQMTINPVEITTAQTPPPRIESRKIGSDSLVMTLDSSSTTRTQCRPRSSSLSTLVACLRSDGVPDSESTCRLRLSRPMRPSVKPANTAQMSDARLRRRRTAASEDELRRSVWPLLHPTHAAADAQLPPEGAGSRLDVGRIWREVSKHVQSTQRAREEHRQLPRAQRSSRASRRTWVVLVMRLEQVQRARRASPDRRAQSRQR